MQEDYWEKGTQSRKSKEQWFNVSINIVMKRMGHNESDLHVLQWRHGCEVEQQGSELVFSKGISEYAYDGEDFLSFDDKESQWIALVDAALPTKRKFDNVPILNQFTKGYLKIECVDWLNKFREYADEELRNGGIRPNHDGSFQLRKSVEINKAEVEEYDCFVTHKSIKEPVITEWEHQEKTIESLPAGVAYIEESVLEKGSTEKHSLYYIYTALSKPVSLPGIYQFTVMGLLDDIQIDYYNSVEQKKIPKQTWMKEKMQEDYWEKGTQSRKSKEQWFNVNVDILMKRMGHNESDRHVLQWRHGCEVEQQGSELVFSKGISEYAYDGDNFLSFDDKESQWVAPVVEALPTKRKWDNVPILNQYTKGYLEKECVDWLNKFREYGDEELRKASSPDVHVFARKSSDETKLKLTCMATGFYAKDVMMTIRKYCTSLPENEVESTGIRPNHDGTFQLKKSVEIQEDEKAEYSCFVSHRTFESITLKLEKHSLYYIYTALSKPVDLPGIYQFTAMGLLDDRQIDYYNSKEQKKIPKQTWMKEKMQEDYWEKGTQSRKSKEQWFNVNVDILMKRMGHNESDLHVLQWRHGCEVEQQGSELVFSKGISEYAYDGDNFLSFDDKESQWVAPVAAAVPTKRKWDNVPILNQYTKGYLEKECVDWLNKFREYAGEELRKASTPAVHVFAKRSIKDKSKLKLTCLATGFYPRDVTMGIRKSCKSLPEDEVESTGIRPNHDGSYQLRKSVEIKEDEKAEYDCFVSHRALKEPIIITWGN
ncbi:MHC class I antigen [Labeo rohita]|uniref:MHC class I antigen n=1 Tax=Labeo rohita TaxID=84645 RepID=A0A498MHK7_LABRO|nr:MHC class I antigen [Labeo rohita]